MTRSVGRLAKAETQATRQRVNLLFSLMLAAAFVWILYVFTRLSRQVSQPLRQLTGLLDLGQAADAPAQVQRLRERADAMEGIAQRAPEEIEGLRASLQQLLRRLLETLEQNRRYARTLSQRSARLAHQASHDTLTQLPNREHFQATLVQEVGRCSEETAQLAVMFIDLDRFKAVNDSLGHEMGDALLCAVSERLGKCFRRGDTLCRIGGDEFAAIVTDFASIGVLEEIAHRAIDSVSRGYRLQEHEVYIGASIGISLFPSDGRDAATLTRNADAAMYLAKEEGKNRACFFTEELNLRNRARLMLETKLHQAIYQGHMYLLYQPQLPLRSAEPLTVECLLRWRDPEAGLVLPGEFIPIAEESGVIQEIGAWVMESAARQMAEWLAAGRTLQRMAVNVSPVQLRRLHFAQDLLGILARVGLAAERLELEITETALIGDEAVVLDNLEQLTQAGVSLALDDFGSGYASMRYLHRLPLRRLKMDLELLRAVPADPRQSILVRGIIQMANALGLECVAEGVETQAQASFLRQQGCGLAQGYLFAEPMGGVELSDWLEDYPGGHDQLASMASKRA